MAEVLGEFDPASPAPVSHCKKMSSLEFEIQGARETQHELKKLINFLEANPQTAYNVIRRKKRDELNFVSNIKVKFMSAIQGDQYLEGYFTDQTCQEELANLKHNLISAFDYAQEAKGSSRRFSRRLAEKRQNLGGYPTTRAAAPNGPPPVPPPETCPPVPPPETCPPVPPPAPPLVPPPVPPPVVHPPLPPPVPPIVPPPALPPSLSVLQGRKKNKNTENVPPIQLHRTIITSANDVDNQKQTEINLTSRNNNLLQSIRGVSGRRSLRSSTSEAKISPVSFTTPALITKPQQKSKFKTMKKTLSKKLSKSSLHQALQDEISNPRIKLRCINAEGSPSMTPYQVSRQRREEEQDFPMFNMALVHKFRNARSPSTSPSGYFSDSSYFDSPS